MKHYKVRHWVSIISVVSLTLLFSFTSLYAQSPRLPSPANVAVIEISGMVNERPEFFSIFNPEAQTLKNYVERLTNALSDPDAHAVLIKLNSPRIGWAKASQLRRLILDLREAKKPVYMYLRDAEYVHYYIASAADKILLSPACTLMITGMGIDVYHIKGLLDKLHVKTDLIVIGQYKSAAEPLTEEMMSETVPQMYDEILDMMYEKAAIEIAESFSITTGKVKEIIDKAIGTDPFYPEAYYTRAQIHEYLGEDAQALQDFERAKDLFSSKGFIRKNIMRLETKKPVSKQVVPFSQDLIVFLKNGRQIEGRLKREEQDAITLDVLVGNSFGTVTIQRQDISSMQRIK